MRPFTVPAAICPDPRRAAPRRPAPRWRGHPAVRGAVAVLLLSQLAATPSSFAQTAASGSSGGVASASATSNSGTRDVQRLVAEGKHAQALKVIEEALAKTPKDPQLQFQRGVVLSMLNRRPEALDAFKNLVADNPTMAPAYNNMAVIYAAMADYENAKASLDKAIRISPEYATAYQNLGDVYVQFATQAYQKSLQLDKSDPGVAPKLALLQDVLLPPAERSAAGKAGARNAPRNAPTAVAAAASPVNTAGAAAPDVRAAASVPARAAPAAPAATGAASGQAVADATAEVSATVRKWAAAWSERDAAAYIQFYAPTFVGQAKSHDAWRAERTERITQRSRIKVEVSDLVASVIGDRAEVRFRQSYESDGPREVSRKLLSLVRGPGGQWLIVKETSGG